MADDLDQMLQGQDKAPASPAQTEGQEGEPIEGEEPKKEPTSEEVEFNKLAGSTQDRIKKLVQDKRELLERNRRLETIQGSVPPPPPGVVNPDVKSAVEKLDEVGIATKDYTKEQINESLASLRYENEINRLTDKYSGAKGEPQFVREEYEEFVSSHPQYKNYFPEDVFKEKMFRDEFLNLEVAERQSPESKGTKTLKPTKTQVTKESLTPEYIEEQLKSLQEPQRSQWYNEHVDEINAVLGKMSPA
jgi:hypothetical protein